MGIAAYNRGSSALSNSLDREARVEFEIMDNLNALVKFPDAGTPFGPIWFSAGNGGVWAECPVSGKGFWYRTIHEAVRRWNVQIVGFEYNHWIAQPIKGPSPNTVEGGCFRNLQDFGG